MKQTTKSRTKRNPRSANYYSVIAGPLQHVGPKPYHVAFRNVAAGDSWLLRLWTRIIAIGSILMVLALDIILFYPDHWVINQRPEAATNPASIVMLICLAALQLFVLVTAISASRATLKAQNPIPVRIPRKLRVAMVTTRAPGEPIDMVETTLAAARRIKYPGGKVDVWLLDETGDQTLRELCEKLGVRYFSRSGVLRWNTVRAKRSRLPLKRKDNEEQRPRSEFYAARTKHGNFNAWMEHLAEYDISYDILAGVDTDHVPERNYLERMLGYFRDEDVAYVVGPQVYGNYERGLDGLVTRWSESQASFFQSSVQRAGNASGSPMFVGTNYAIRMKVLDQIGGFQPCITEDMATGLAVHANRNPKTGNHWRSVYTPDVLAIGQGPDLWGTYFSQQWRWAGGTFDTWRSVVWKRFGSISWKARTYYALILTFYPVVALTWLLGIVSSLTYLFTGATAILAPWNEFAALYLMTAVMQFSLYFWNRRFNVSPHEPEGTYGVPGIVLTSFTAPVYLSALIGITLGKKPHFVVTAKGDNKAIDRLQAFHIHLFWAVVLMLGMLYGITHDNAHPAMMAWIILQLVICLAPPVLWAAQLWSGFAAKVLAFGKETKLTITGETYNG